MTNLLFRDLRVFPMALSQPFLFLLLLLLHHLYPPLLQGLEVVLVHRLQFLHLCIHLVFHYLARGCGYLRPEDAKDNNYLSCLHELLAKDGSHLLHLTCHCQLLAAVSKRMRSDLNSR